MQQNGKFLFQNKTHLNRLMSFSLLAEKNTVKQ